MQTREVASTGYRQALAAHQSTKGEHTDPPTAAVRAAVEQYQTLRQRREVEMEFADGMAAGQQLASEAAAADRHDLALKRAREDKAGRLPEVRRLLRQVWTLSLRWSGTAGGPQLADPDEPGEGQGE